MAGFDAEQLKNAQVIMEAAKSLGLPAVTARAGFMRPVPAARRGLGSYDRMDPTFSATNFFKALQRVAGWEALEPTIAIRRVQRNTDRNHYTGFRVQAMEVFKALGGEAAAVVVPSGVCRVDGTKPSGTWSASG